MQEKYCTILILHPLPQSFERDVEVPKSAEAQRQRPVGLGQKTQGDSN